MWPAWLQHNKPLAVLWLCVLIAACVGVGVKSPAAADRLDPQYLDYSTEANPEACFGAIRILSALRLPAIEFEGHDLDDLSGLAWSEDEGLLYALSNLGVVFRFRLQFKNGLLSGISLHDSVVLKKKSGKTIKDPDNDAEALHLFNAGNGRPGDEQMLIAYERKPRIIRHGLDGVTLEKLKLPKALNRKSDYWSRNKMLEAVTVHPQYGVLTIPELPLDDAPENELVVYALDGRQWLAPRDPERALGVVAMEVMPDGDLLLLRRRFSLIAPRWEVELNRLTLNDDGTADIKRLANLKTGDALVVDNFEGLSHYRNNQYFMVSDNNRNGWQQTVLVQFELQE